MIALQLELSRDEARAALTALGGLKDYTTGRMAYRIWDPTQTAALGWVIADRIERRLREATEGAR